MIVLSKSEVCCLCKEVIPEGRIICPVCELGLNKTKSDIAHGFEKLNNSVKTLSNAYKNLQESTDKMVPVFSKFAKLANSIKIYK